MKLVSGLRELELLSVGEVGGGQSEVGTHGGEGKREERRGGLELGLNRRESRVLEIRNLG